MSFVSFEIAGQQTYGLWKDESNWIQVPQVFQAEYPDLKSVIAANKLDECEALTRQSGKSVTASQAHLLPVIPKPSKNFCIGLNYKTHVAETKRADSDYPAIFTRFADSLTAHNAPLPHPKETKRFDFEGELAVIIGKGGRNITQAQAFEHIAGYACFNDGSLRDYQRKSAQWTIGKNFDATGGFGPWIVTPDELPLGAKGLRIQSRLNGQVMQDANTLDFLWNVREALVIITECMTLEPGDVIITGTPAGVGYARNPPVWMEPGDVCEIEIEGIGVLSNTIVQEA